MLEMINDGEKDFVGIGKLMLDTRAQSWNIPQLHFLVDWNAGHYEATCLEFGNVSSGASQEESAERLVAHILAYIQAVMQDGLGFEEFKEIAANNFMSDYWRAYRHIEFCLAEKKHDISHEIENRITRAIQVMFDKKVKALIAPKAREAAEEALAEYEKMSAFTLKDVSYAQLDKAA
jgi:hypothetical protein